MASKIACESWISCPKRNTLKLERQKVAGWPVQPLFFSLDSFLLVISLRIGIPWDENPHPERGNSYPESYLMNCPQNLGFVSLVISLRIVPWDENNQEKPTIWENILWFIFSFCIEQAFPSLGVFFRLNKNVVFVERVDFFYWIEAIKNTERALMFQTHKASLASIHSGKLTQLAWTWTLNEDVFPLENVGYPSQLC